MPSAVCVGFLASVPFLWLFARRGLDEEEAVMDMEGETYDDDVLELKGAEVPGDIGELNGEEYLVEGLARCIKGQSRISNDFISLFSFFRLGVFSIYPSSITTIMSLFPR